MDVSSDLLEVYDEPMSPRGIWIIFLFLVVQGCSVSSFEATAQSGIPSLVEQQLVRLHFLGSGDLS
jgi:hypothetical protein